VLTTSKYIISYEISFTRKAARPACINVPLYNKDRNPAPQITKLPALSHLNFFSFEAKLSTFPAKRSRQCSMNNWRKGIKKRHLANSWILCAEEMSSSDRS
jgi:hypothetical protein